ncbi:uncharacterized protein ACIBXB_019583 [Morphnus guianensis]
MKHGSPSSCSGVRYHPSLQMRSAVAQSFSLSASELGWGVGKLHGAVLIYRKTAKMQESKEWDWQSFSDCSRAEKQNHIQKTSVGQWTSRGPQKIYIFIFGRTQQETAKGICALWKLKEKYQVHMETHRWKNNNLYAEISKRTCTHLKGKLCSPRKNSKSE